METNGISFTRHIYNKAPGTDRPNEYHLIKNALQRPFLPEAVRIERAHPEKNSSIKKHCA